MQRIFRILCWVLCLIMIFSLCSCNSNNKKKPHIVSTKYETTDNVIADVDITAFGADSTGSKDSTQAIISALDFCAENGGGTVWVPEGKYILTDKITIPSYVTLRGDWQDPDVGNEYGSILIADIPEEDTDQDGLIRISSSSGVNGLTVYYKNQSLDNVKKYGFTFYMMPGIMGTIKNCTILNGYRGIGTTNANPHEQMIVKNVKGTVLNTGMAINNSSDVNTVTGLTLSPKYWANAGNGFQTEGEDEITAYTKANGCGMHVTDAEQQQLYDVTLTGYKYGILFPCVETRYMGSGSFYKLNISNCEYGIYVEKGIYGDRLTNIDYRWGYNIANSSIEGNSYSIYNDVSDIDGYSGCFKLSGVKLDGETYGNIRKNSASADLSEYFVEVNPIVKTTGSYFKTLTEGADEEDIQAALDKAGQSGGGIVYLAPGKYVVKNGLVVPGNVLLRGSAGTAHRMAEKGTVILASYEKVENTEAAEKAEALVTLNGDNAGVSGLFFHFGANISKISTESSFDYYPYVVRGKGKGVYATNLCIAGASHGIDFTDCPGYVIDALHGCSITNAMCVSGGGTIMNCLQNGTVITRCVYEQMDEAKLFDNLFNPITRCNSELIRIKEGSGDKVLNCFGYGLKNLVNTVQSEDTLCINVGADNLGDMGTGLMHMFDGGSVTVINSLRYNGSSYDESKCDLKIYNRMAIWSPEEADIN